MPRLLDSRFTRSLADTPKTYDGAQGFLVAVGGDGSSLVFVDPLSVAAGGGLGSVIARVAFINEADGFVNIGNPIIGTMNRVRLVITTPFAANSSVTIGRETATAELASASVLDWTRVGISEVSTSREYSVPTQLRAAVTRGDGSPGTGTAIVICEFIQGAI